MSLWTKIFGDPNVKVIQKLQPTVAQVASFESALQALSDAELKAKTIYFKEQLAAGKTLDAILPEAFAVVREASRRVTTLRHFDVQVIAGMILHRGEIAEMKTGEGKTLVATLPVYLNALSGKGVHVVTVNDYLSRRDMVWMGKIYNALGLTISCLQNQASFIYDETRVAEPNPVEDAAASFRVEDEYLRACTRQEAYAADITYGTNNEFGFDYLRDNMVGALEDKVQRGWNFAIVDEVDSILIDEARTPLIISAPAEESADLYYKFAQLIPRLDAATDYNIDEKMRTATLTEAGLNHIEKLLNVGNIYTVGGVQMVHHLEQALRAHTLFERDRDYVVNEGEILIIDEFTGRMMIGRRYSEGLHQAIEAKENVEIKRESRTLATITFQNYFRMYTKLSGMTGTALTEAEEFAKIYKLDVTVIPTNKQPQRQDLPDRIYANTAGKYQAVINMVRDLNAKQQPVLIGTISVQQNEMLDRLLTKEGIPHEILNAKNHAREGEIIAQAGKAGSVTVATNMAGRGVDIILGGAPFNQEEHDKVAALGGLFVLGTERHEARRIDNQLRGRSGRQGDPGTSQFYVSLDDDLMRIFGSDRIQGMMQRMGLPPDVPIENGMVSRALESAQKRVEGHNFDIRKHLVEYDDVMNKQREIIYKRRDQYLQAVQADPTKLKAEVLDMVEDEIEQVVSFHTAGVENGDWDGKEIFEVVNTIFPLTPEQKTSIETLVKDGRSGDPVVFRTKLIEQLMENAKGAYERVEESIAKASSDPEAMRTIEKELLIRSIDNLWIEHLDEMGILRHGINLRGYAQVDPLVAYKSESKSMFLQLLNLVQKQVVYSIFKVGFVQNWGKSIMETSQVQLTAPDKGSADKAFTDVSKDPYESAQRVESAPTNKEFDAEGHKVGRNDPCPCGSGKKYKKCHGA